MLAYWLLCALDMTLNKDYSILFYCDVTWASSLFVQTNSEENIKISHVPVTDGFSFQSVQNKISVSRHVFRMYGIS